jgi:Arc/MetJ-type ribon-helix-helix transcriptional regulator
MTVSLPPALLCQFEEVRKKESRTRSELVREALRAYFESRYPVDSPAPDELSALRRGRSAYNRGDAVTLKAFLNDVDPHHHRSGAKGLPKAPATRSGAR